MLLTSSHLPGSVALWFQIGLQLGALYAQTQTQEKTKFCLIYIKSIHSNKVLDTVT